MEPLSCKLLSGVKPPIPKGCKANKIILPGPTLPNINRKIRKIASTKGDTVKLKQRIMKQPLNDTVAVKTDCEANFDFPIGNRYAYNIDLVFDTGSPWLNRGVFLGPYFLRDTLRVPVDTIRNLKDQQKIGKMKLAIHMKNEIVEVNVPVHYFINHEDYTLISELGLYYEVLNATGMKHIKQQHMNSI